MQVRKNIKDCLWAMLFAALFLQGCIEPFDLKTGEDANRLLVVSGMVTDQNNPELNRVTLSWTAPFDSENKQVLFVPALQAEVSLRDNQGNSMAFYEGGRGGDYILGENNYQVEQGKAYSLHIKLIDGREYASRPEVLRPSPSIQDITYDFKEFVDVVRNSAGVLIERKSVGFDVKVKVQDPEERGNYYRWDTEGVFEFFTDVGDSPLPNQCWADMGSTTSKVVVNDDRLINGRVFEQPVVVVPADIPTKYRIKVRQYSLSAEAYEFWRLFNQQQSSVGSIFDPPPASIIGNMYSVTDPEERVIGYFSACGLTEKFTVINRQLYAPFPGLPNVLPKGDCRYTFLYPKVTNERPIGF